MLELFGKKRGMSQRFSENGDLVPVTVIECGPCTVVQKKSAKKEGYDALQLGFEEIKKAQNVNRPRKGLFAKAKTPLFRHLSEFRSNEVVDVNVGDILRVELFEVGDLINVQGCTIGKGFQGAMKRHGFHGGPASHGSAFHRATGSVGMHTDPARVLKNKKMPGHMGDRTRTIKNLEVVEIDAENNLLFVKGAVPGCPSGYVRITHTRADFKKRFKKDIKPEVSETEKGTEDAKS